MSLACRHVAVTWQKRRRFGAVSFGRAMVVGMWWVPQEVPFMDMTMPSLAGACGSQPSRQVSIRSWAERVLADFVPCVVPIAILMSSISVV
ncbi:MAG: hypothetical protein EBR86_04930 [Planctomycetia bacterium]|nr:hypothetical protein [Planctomycetia bacterium]